MDIEELNKTQIILLTLLVSFVTSIATGIVTVSLINQAPPVVTDTIHKVIEKTVERVVPGEQKATIIENTKTIIISDQDFIINAIEKNSESLVRVFSSVVGSESEGIAKDNFEGLGVILSAEGKIMMDSKGLLKTGKYFIYFNDLKLQLNILEDLPDNDIVLLKVQLPEAKKTDLVFKPIDLGNSDILKLGQSVISLSGKESNIVLTGIISNLNKEEFPIEEVPVDGKIDKTAEKQIKTVTIEIETTLNSQLPMGLLIDLEGEVIGVKSRSDFYIPINLIKQSIDKLDQALVDTTQS